MKKIVMMCLPCLLLLASLITPAKAVDFDELTLVTGAVTLISPKNPSSLKGPLETIYKNGTNNVTTPKNKIKIFGTYDLDDEEVAVQTFLSGETERFTFFLTDFPSSKIASVLATGKKDTISFTNKELESTSLLLARGDVTCASDEENCAALSSVLSIKKLTAVVKKRRYILKGRFGKKTSSGRAKGRFNLKFDINEVNSPNDGDGTTSN